MGLHTRTRRWPALVIAAITALTLAAPARVEAQPEPKPLNPGVSIICGELRIGIDLLLFEWTPFGLPDEGWHWIDTSQKLRFATGRVWDVHVAGPDTPATHDSHDADFKIRLDPGQEDLLSVVSSDEDTDGTVDSLAVEWESGIRPEEKSGDGANPTFPKWAWPSDGDRVWTDGHWVFDCGHPSGGLFHPEIHPARAVASMRNQAATLPGTGSTPVPVTLTDLYIHGRGGYMVNQLNCGIDIILGDHPDTCGQDPPPADESYKTTRIDTDFEFDVCLPPQPANGAFSKRIDPGPRNTVSIAPQVTKKAAAGACVGDPQFDQHWMAHVKVPLAGTGTAPEEVYARRIYTGWVVPPDPVLPHRRLTLTQMDLHEDHDLDPGDGELSFMWMNLNRAPDAWIRLADHANGDMNDYDDDGGILGDGLMSFTGASFEFYLRHEHDYTVKTNGYDQDCLDFFFDDHFLGIFEYAVCAVDFPNHWANDEIAKVNASFAAHDLGADELPAGGQYELSVVVDEIPLADEDTADLSAFTVCTAPDEVALVGRPIACAARASNSGPGLPRSVALTDGFGGGTATATVDAGTWRNDPVYDVGLQPCVVTGPGTARCGFGTVPDTSATTASLTATPTSPGILVSRVEVMTASNDPDLTNNVATTSLEVFTPVTIDVAPGDSTNVVNLNRGGTVAIAILTTPDFDASTIDMSTLCFGDADAPAERACVERHGSGHLQDVDRDGDLDLLLHYLVSDAGIDVGDSRACLKGRTVGGTGVFGCDAVAPTLNQNSPIIDGAAIDGHRFHELNVTGAPNAAGLVVTAVKGRQIDVRDSSGMAHTILIAAVGSVTMPVGAAEKVPVYQMTYTNAKQPVPQPLCAGGENEAITFSGDRYDAASKTIIATGDETRGWINIACQGTALAKMFLNRHTEVSQRVATTRAERQAVLKMLTGDVCGDGTAFTVAGQPLLWKDQKNVTTFMAAPASIEAVWSDTGAVCLNEPRRPEFAAEIAAHCGRLPRCSDSTRGYVTSAIP